MDLHWEDDFTISTGMEGGMIIIRANREGLLSLAKNLISLAEETPGSHIHFDEHNSLENGSADLDLTTLPKGIVIIKSPYTQIKVNNK